MNSVIPLMAVAAVSALGTLAAAPSAKAVTFASYTSASSATGGVPDIVWTNNGTNGSIAAQNGTGGASNIAFSFDVGPWSSADGGSPLNALLTLAGTSSTPANAGPPLSQGDIGSTGAPASFSIIYEGPTFSYNGKTFTTGVTDLLSGTFVNGMITGAAGASSGTVLGDNNAQGAITYSSDILSFSNSGTKDFSLGLTSITLPLAIARNGYLRSFSAVSTGSFDSDLAGGGGGGVPEPASWALMLIGVGTTGMALRGRRRIVTAV